MPPASLNAEGLRSRRQLLSFNRRAARELLSEAVSIAEEAKTAHDAMEAFNIAAMDWEGATILTEWVVSEFEEMAEAVKPAGQ